MEKKFKPFDKVLVRVWAAIEWRAAFFSHKKDTAYYTTDGDRYEENNILPYEGNEHLVGTTDEPEEEVRLEEGEWILTSDFIEGLGMGCASLGRFRRIEYGQFAKEVCLSKDLLYKYAIRFKDFDPSNMEETLKHILVVKNGRIVKYKSN